MQDFENRLEFNVQRDFQIEKYFQAAQRVDAALALNLFLVKRYRKII
jgi:hypothetical protein